MNITNSSILLLPLLAFITTIQSSIAQFYYMHEEDEEKAITRNLYINQQCNTLHSNLTANRKRFKSIGQLEDRLFLITFDDYLIDHYLIDLPLDNLQPLSPLYLNQSVHLKKLILFDNVLFIPVPSEVMSNFILLQYKASTGSLILGGELFVQPLHPLESFNCLMSLEEDNEISVGNNNNSGIQCTREESGEMGYDDERRPFINSPKEHIFYEINVTTLGFTEMTFKNNRVSRPSSPILYLCRYGTTRLDRLLLHRKPCSSINSTTYPMPKLEWGFSGFISRQYLYLFTAHSVKIIEWSDSFNISKVVNVTAVALEDFISCAEPPKVMVESFNWKKYYLLYPLLALTSVLLLLSISYWLFRYYSVKQQSTYKVEYLVGGKDKDNVSMENN